MSIAGGVSISLSMQYLYVLVLLLSLCHCRPSERSQEGSGVEIQKQTIIKIPDENQEGRSLSNEDEKEKEKANTRDILQKIAEVNLSHGLLPKKRNRNYYTNINTLNPQQNNENKGKQLPNFQFPNTPFVNPIFNYLQNENRNDYQTKYSTTENDDTIPEGYAIRRKVTHQQTIITPGFYQPGSEPYYNQMLPPPDAGQYGLISPNQLQQTYPLTSHELPGKTGINTTENNTDELNQAKQNYLINNIKSIISNSQTGQGFYSNAFNPYMPQYIPPQYNPYVGPYQNLPQQNHYNIRTNPYMNPYAMYASPQPYYPQMSNPFPSQNPNQKFSDTYYANLQTAKDPETAKFLGPSQSLPSQNSRQFNGPFAQYFPIVIRNPFQQMVQAFTSMVEYGPEADICRNKFHQRSSKDSRFNRYMKSIGTTEKPNFEFKDEDTNTEIVIQKIEETTEESSDDKLYIQGLEMVTNPKQQKEQETESKPEMRNVNIDNAEVVTEEDKFFSFNKKPKNDDTRSGIFIQKLKVRKGGVAIAGPGGIATAGSGGTAIVGPNGYAYTQPNGVAIVGPGSKVIAVDPSINLSDYIMNITRRGASTPRIGKIVAVGPVVYHNIGQN